MTSSLKNKITHPARIIALFGVARSGTSWLGSIVDSCPNVIYRFQPLFSYEFRGRITPHSTKPDYESFFRDLFQADSDFLTQKDKKTSGLHPDFKKDTRADVLAFKENRFLYLAPNMLSHFPDKLKSICIVRNPCAVIASWVQNPKEFPPGAKVEEEWRFGACKNENRDENFFGFYKWRESTHLFLDMRDKYPDQVKVIRYEDLVTKPERMVKELFSFAELDFSAQTKTFLTSSTSSHLDSPYSVYKNRSVIDHWKSTLDPRIADEIRMELTGTRLEEFLR